MKKQKKNHNHHKTVDQELSERHFRVAIFGSARIKKNSAFYKGVFHLAYRIGKHGFDIVTGGGPGLMEAASAGHQKGDRENRADSIGLTIRLPWEVKYSKHLEIKKHFNRFSGRLDEFMMLSNVVIVFPGGIGTTLELFYTWQLTQVKHICPIPIILIGDMWKELIVWVKKWQLKQKLIDTPDLNNVFVVKNNRAALKIIAKAYDVYKKGGKNYCVNIKKYKLR